MQGTDVLFPRIGEIIGGSVREESYEKLLEEIHNRGMKEEVYDWYLDTRKYGTCPHGGFGLGFEASHSLRNGVCRTFATLFHLHAHQRTQNSNFGEKQKKINTNQPTS